jgi:GT2 family glycosyltransferase
MVEKEFPKVDVIKSNTNTGFSAGNNLARNGTKGEIVLFLNPDTELKDKAIEKCLRVLQQHGNIGAVTCKVLLPGGKLDYSCHRGLPTVWNTFCYWTGLSKLFPHHAAFAGYTASYLNTDKPHKIDCISGTFLMVKREVLDKINWWDEDYWWNGEDIEFCFRVRKAGYGIWYEPSETVLHFKGSSSGLWSTGKLEVPKEIRVRAAKSAARAMRIFVTKHERELGSWPLMQLVKTGIFLLEKYRLWKIEKGLKYA